jgi:hypothetical protein
MFASILVGPFLENQLSCDCPKPIFNFCPSPLFLNTLLNFTRGHVTRLRQSAPKGEIQVQAWILLARFGL